MSKVLLFSLLITTFSSQPNFGGEGFPVGGFPNGGMPSPGGNRKARRPSGKVLEDFKPRSRTSGKSMHPKEIKKMVMRDAMNMFENAIRGSRRYGRFRMRGKHEISKLRAKFKRELEAKIDSVLRSELRSRGINSEGISMKHRHNHSMNALHVPWVG